MKKYDVCIIGAGPAGLTAGRILASNNLSVIILEKKKDIGFPVCCGEAISKKSLEKNGIFDRSYIDSEIKGFRIFFPNGKFFYAETGGFLINRGLFEKHLHNLAKLAGAEIRTGSGATNIKRSGRGFLVSAKEGTYFSSFIIGADGPVSAVDSALLGNTPRLVPARQYKINNRKFIYGSKGFIDFYFDTLSPYYFWVFKKTKEINIGGITADKESLPEFCQKKFSIKAPQGSVLSHGFIPAGGVKKSLYNNSAFLIGDAAGLTNPVTFAGIYTALESGAACADIIVKHRAYPGKVRLSEYEKQMKKRIFARKSTLTTAKNCYRLPHKTLNFVGSYFSGRHYEKKDFIRFFCLLSKNPSVLKHLPSLIKHGLLLKFHMDEL